MQRSRDLGVTNDESSVEVAEPEERTDLPDGLWSSPVEDGVDLGGVHAELAVSDDVAEEGHLVLEELTLLCLDPEMVSAEAFQHLLDVLEVLLHVVRVDQDVVKVDDDTLVDEVVHNLVDEVLEGGGRVGEAERHDEVFVQAARGSERRFPLIARTDAYQVIRRPQVDLGEDLPALEPIEDVVDVGDRMAPLDGAAIDLAVVDDGTDLSFILLVDEEQRGSYWRFGWADETALWSFTLPTRFWTYSG